MILEVNLLSILLSLNHKYFGQNS